MTQHQELSLAVIRIDGNTQARVAINTATVTEYADALTEGEVLPAVVVFFDGAGYYLADGFHRFHAHRAIDARSITADVRTGTLHDARLYAYGANRVHGLRRTNEDKRRAVAGMLAEVPDWSDNKIAKHVGVHHSTVGEHRASLAESASEEPAERTYTTKHGTQAVMKTGAIGKTAPAPAQVESDSTPAPSAKKEKRVLPVIAQPEPDEDDMLAAVEALAEENDQLRDRLAVELMDASEEEKLAAQTLITDLRKENTTLQAHLDAARSQLNGYLVENAELKKQVAFWRRKAEKVAA